MINLQAPSQPRVPLGSARFPNGAVVEIKLSDEWARYFNSLNGQVLANASLLEAMAQQAMMMPDGVDSGDSTPGIPGQRGANGDAGLALFMLADSPDEQVMMFPPSANNFDIPLAQKDAADGVPGLTALKLNLKNAAGTFVNWFTSATTAVRTWTMPDKDGTVAVLSDFATPPAIGSTTRNSGAFTTVTTTGNTTVGNATAPTTFAVNGTAAGAGGGALAYVANAGGIVLAMGNRSAIVGGAYDALPLLYATTGPIRTNVALQVDVGFGCNGKTPQTAFALGAAAVDLPTVIALANNLRTMSINNGIGS